MSAVRCLEEVGDRVIGTAMAPGARRSEPQFRGET